MVTVNIVYAAFMTISQFLFDWGPLFYVLMFLLLMLFGVQSIKLKKDNLYLKKQMHHRVKNNLQLVSSLINLQLRHSIDDSVSSELEQSKSRLSALNTLNKIIFKKDTLLPYVSIEEYLQQLMVIYHRQLGNGTTQISDFIDTDIQTTIAVEKAIPLGLMINEILLFCLRNNLLDQERGISISLVNHEPTNKIRFELKNENNIIDWDKIYRGTLSEKIITRLANQLQGEIEMEHENHIRFALEFA